MSSLADRLRQLDTSHSNYDGCWQCQEGATLNEAADELDAKDARIAELEASLRCVCGGVSGPYGNETCSG